MTFNDEACVRSFFTLESIVSFETTRYEVEEGDGHVELTIALTEGVPFHASLELQTIDDTTTTTTGQLCSVMYTYLMHKIMSSTVYEFY